MLKKVENYLENLPKSQLWMLYIMVLIIGASVLYNILPDMMYKNELLKESISSLEQNIKNSSPVKLQLTLKKNRKKLLEMKSLYLKLKEDVNLLASKLHSLRFAVFDDKEWVNTLQDLLKQSVNYNLQVKYVKNEDINKASKNLSLIKRKKHIQINVIGKYADIVKYINYIESLPLLLKFGDITLTADKDANVEATLDFDTFGIGI